MMRCQVCERNLIFLQTELSKLSIPLASAAAVCIDTQVYAFNTERDHAFDQGT
jgi:hypothetical protein